MIPEIQEATSTAVELGNQRDCGARCSCGGWQRTCWCPQEAVLSTYCGACGAQMSPPLDVWPAGVVTTHRGRPRSSS